MKHIALTYFVFSMTMLVAQQWKGVVVNKKENPVGFVTVKNVSQNTFSQSEIDGTFSISTKTGDTILFYRMGYDSLQIIRSKSLPQKVKLHSTVQHIAEANAKAKKLEQFDVGALPRIKGVRINNGTNAIIELKNLSGAKSTANPREIFAKIPGLNIWESDGSGIQIGIGGRGLSPKRTANFNTRQNGYDISADALGYPESYYTPPFEALKAIEITRGSAALQFGSQFGGLLNFVIRDIPRSTPFELTSRFTGGTYGYLGTFNRVTGSAGRIGYQAYHQYKKGNGYRENSAYQQHQAFLQGSYYITDRATWTVEYTHMNYLTQQAGGLTDVMFEEDPRQSVRERNWFKVGWNVLATHFDYAVSSKSHFNLRAFGMVSERKSLGFLGKISQADPGGKRQLIAGDFKNYGVEARFLHRYSLDKKEQFRGAFLFGGRFYQGRTKSYQGAAPEGKDANFTFLSPLDDLEASAFSFPSQNVAGFIENILFIKNKATINFGARLENISTASEGYYKRYSIHPFNGDTINTYTLYDTNTVERTVPLFGFGGAYKINANNRIYFNATQNYRAINFSDIRINNPNIVIDSTIRDEYGYTAELGFRGIINSFWLYDVAGFYLFYGDKIGVAPKQGTIYKERTNIGDAFNTGVELLTEIDFLQAFNDSTKHHLNLFVNASYIYTEYIRSKEKNYLGKQVEYVSPYIIRSGLKWRNKRFTIQVQGSYTAEQFSDASNAIEPSGDAVIGLIPAYLIFDFSSKVNITKAWSLELGLNNFTNKKYFTRRATAYPGPGILPSDGINAYLTVQYYFKAKRN